MTAAGIDWSHKIANYSSEQLIEDANRVIENAGDNPLAISPLPLVEAGCGWLNTGLMPSGMSSRDEFEITRGIVVQTLAAMMADGYLFVKAHS